MSCKACPYWQKVVQDETKRANDEEDGRCVERCPAGKSYNRYKQGPNGEDLCIDMYERFADSITDNEMV